MNNYLKYGVSAIALLSTLALANAQTGERQGGGNTSQSPSGGRGGEGQAQGSGSGAGEKAQPEARGSQGERGAQTDAKDGKADGKADSKDKQPKSAQDDKSPPKGQRAEKDAQPGRAGEAKSDDKDKTRESKSDAPRGRDAADKSEKSDGDKKAADTRTDARTESRTNVNINVTPQQKTRVKEVIVRDSSIRKYRRSEINFSLNVGTRIPETIVYYDAPPALISIVPDFRRYKVIVLDDVVLIVDPRTREIVDVVEI